MVNYLSKLCSHLYDICEPPRQLTHAGALWEWAGTQQTVFVSIKQAIAETITYYNPLQFLALQSNQTAENKLSIASIKGGISYNKYSITMADTLLLICIQIQGNTRKHTRKSEVINASLVQTNRVMYFSFIINN